MSYQLYIRLPENEKLDEQFIDDSIGCLFNITSDRIKLELLSFCMVNDEDDNSISYIILNVNKLYNCLVSERKKFYEETLKSNNEIVFCGREYEKQYTNFSEESIKHDLCEKLVLFKTAVKTPDYFEDSEKFYEKVSEINEALDIDFMVNEIIDIDFINFYNKYIEDCD